MQSRRLATFTCLFLLQGLTFSQTVIPFGVVLSGAEAVPPTAWGMSGCGRLWLQGTNLVYRFATIAPGIIASPIELHGPGGPGTNGPLLGVLNSSRYQASSDFCGTAEGLPPPQPGPIPPTPGFVFEGVVPMTPEQIEDLMAGLLYATYIFRFYFTLDPPPLELQTRGQITLLDTDSDGVADFRDECPNTPLGALINSHGCSIDQLCPCDGPWRNHGEFLNRMRDVLNDFSSEGLITAQQQRDLLRAAAASDCGKAQH